ncbi:MAG: phenylacetate-CoA oxygenase/reductase subunit PaaK [Arenicella sp.]|nr:phenylacetate-CoA oxygenase/reductase subunit PaaK [Arenicella sp.]
MFAKATVKNITRETHDSVVVSLDVPSDRLGDFTYAQGQNLTFIREIDGEELRRSYSICSSVADNELRVGIKKVEGGLFSTWANEELAVGDTIDVLPPTGHFYTELDATQSNNYIGVAAGSGITPVLSILKTTLETESSSTFTLIYGNKSTDTIMFLEEIEGLKNKYHERLAVFNVLSREIQNSDLLNGRIDGKKISQFLKTLIPADQLNDVFLCGPYEMVTSAQEAFVIAGVEKKNVHSELFGVPEDLQAIANAQAQKSLTDEERSHLVKLVVIIDGKGSKLELARGGESILDAALKVRKDLPFACKAGVCATCKAKVIKGETEMDLNYSLSDEEIQQGFVLTCQAHPISDEVTVDFDEK